MKHSSQKTVGQLLWIITSPKGVKQKIYAPAKSSEDEGQELHDIQGD